MYTHLISHSSEIIYLSNVSEWNEKDNPETCIFDNDCNDLNTAVNND